MNVSIKFTNSTGTTDKIYLYIKFSPNHDIKWWGVTFQVGKVGDTIDNFPFRDMQKIRYINSVVTYEEGVGAIIDKKTDEIIKGQDKINDTISDSDSSGASSDAGSFFDSFSDNSHGLSGIVTAPLNSINAMLSTTCTPLTATFKNKTINLPCGYDFYSQIGEVNTWLNVIEGGLLSYLIIRKLYLLIEKLKDPEEDKVEVMKL